MMLETMLVKKLVLWPFTRASIMWCTKLTIKFVNILIIELRDCSKYDKKKSYECDKSK